MSLTPRSPNPSENSVNDAKKRQVEIAQRPSFYYPDVFGKDNCVYGNLYFEVSDSRLQSGYIIT